MLRYYLTLLLLVTLVFSKASLSRVCDPTKSNPQYTGFRIDKQVTVEHKIIKSPEIHLSLCKDGYLIGDFKVDDGSGVGIPWNQTICNTAECYKISRSKQYALRDIGIFVPGKIVGGLFELKQKEIDSSIDQNYIPIERLISDALYDQWAEINSKSSLKTFHVPLLHTPDILDRKFNTNGKNWFESISANELYKYEIETLNKYKNSLDIVLEKLKEVIDQTQTKIKIFNRFTLDSKPIRKAMKAVNFPKDENLLLDIYKKTIDSLSKKRFNKSKVDLDTLTVLSYIFTHTQFDGVLRSLNIIYDKITTVDDKFKYDIRV